MTIRELRNSVKAGRATIGSWAQLPCTQSAGLLARAGYDWVAVDMEHGAFQRSLLAEMLLSIEANGALPFVRLAEASRENIKAALDSGAQGLIFPMIESREQLDQAIGWSLYPEFGGCRGVGYCRANAFGRELDRYRRDIAGELMLVAQIEHIAAVDRLDDILRHPRLDAIMVGPYDLSGSMGLTAELDHPDVLGALARIADKAAQHGVPMGLHIVRSNPGELEARLAEGYRFIAYGIDTVFLWEQAGRPQIGGRA